MSGFTNPRAVRKNLSRIVDKKMARNARKVQEAEAAVFKLLEKRWTGALKGNKIPLSHRNKMRRDPFFQELVARALAGEPIALDSLDHAPETQKNLDGTVSSRMHEELAGDPRAALCPRCGNDTDNAGEECSPCRDYHAKGKR